jgi:cell wall-associated NlpC family hydrolase
MKREKSMARVLLVLLPIFLVGCGGSPSLEPDNGYDSHPKTLHEVGKSPESVKETLRRQLSSWRGVPYRYGGLGRSGVDCSGFVHLTFKSQFGVHLPRTTRDLSRTGVWVSRDDIRTGDMVFFKTSPSVRHVGIYVDNGRFIHASKKKGVMMSHMGETYWAKRYWQSRRVLRL